jgi:hypothetical protein
VATCVVFLGPTLPLDTARGHLEAQYLPPAGQGDVYRAAAAGARSIGIVDGYFERIPSVWHKEVLWAMAQGARVYGSASMGALRAAELADFGMVGVGRIFEWYRSGQLEDDDEVALLHGPAESGYRAGSEPLVNMRATLARAEEEGILSSAAREDLLAVAKGMHYTERSYPRMLEVAAGAVDERIVRSLRSWVGQGAVDQKAADAVAMLVRMREEEGAPSVEAPGYRFANTVYWERMVSEVEEQRGMELAREDEAVLEALSRDGRRLQCVRRAALARLLVNEHPLASSRPTSDEDIREVTAELCAELGILSDEDFVSFMQRCRLSPEGFSEIVHREAALRVAAEDRAEKLQKYLLEELRASGQYDSVAATAEQTWARRQAGGG